MMKDMRAFNGKFTSLERNIFTLPGPGVTACWPEIQPSGQTYANRPIKQPVYGTAFTSK